MEEEPRATRNAGTATGGVGDIENVGVLDLTGMQSIGELAKITSISNCGVILVPASLMAGLAGIPIRNCGATVPIPEGQHVRLLTGESTLSGESLAAGSKEEVLIAVGELTITSAVHEVGFKQLVIVGQMIAPQGSEGAIGGVLANLTGSAVYYPYSPGAQVRTRKGTSVLTGATLENAAGQETDVLLILGSATITPPVAKAGYQHIVATGDLLAPVESEGVLGARLWSAGLTAFYKAKPRRFTGMQHFSKDFFELLDEPISLMLKGKYTIEVDVPRDLVRQKVAEIFLQGSLRGSPEVVPLLQVLATHLEGNISTLRDESDNNDEHGLTPMP